MRNSVPKAEVLPENIADKTIVWQSSDEGVATVVDGVVTGVNIGTATITATCGDLTAYCDVEVAPVKARSIKLDHRYLELPVGDTVTLSATIKPTNTTDKTIVWTSSDESIATVEWRCKNSKNWSGNDKSHLWRSI